MRGFLTYLLLLLSCSQVLAQLVIDQNYNVQQLVQDVLVGQGVQVSNFQFTGNPDARGYFDGSNSNIGVSEGVIISTGIVADAPGPNGTPNSDEGTDFSGPGNGSLTAIAGGVTSDAAILEFDFIPSSDTVQFKYVFASNEYMFYVGAGVNDVFAFFISGPGITGEMNVALIPGTTIPVTIDNINADENSQYYIDNENPPGSTVEYNGFTQVLTAMAVLQACESYHIRLAIADVGDGLFDSAVFLEARSFTSPTISIDAESSYSASASDLQLVEGCSELTLSFERSEPYDGPLSVAYTLSGTADQSDITTIPPSIDFAPGQAVSTISFDVLEDMSAEGTETMTITLDQLASCGSQPAPSVTFSIEDVVPMTIQITPDVNLNCPEERIIDVTVTDGYAPYDYSWSGSTDTDQSITVFPFNTTTYTATVTDACGFSESASSTISVFNYELMEVTVEDVTVCSGNAATLQANVSGGRPPLLIQWPDGSTGPSYTYTPMQSEQFTIQVTDNCNITEEGSAQVNVDQVEASFTHELTAHATIQFTSNTVDVYNFFWEFGDDSTGTGRDPIHEYQEAGDYPVALTVVNQSGCDTTLRDTVTVYDPLHVYIPNAFTPNADSLNDWFGVVGEGYLYYLMTIYDRWGNILLEGRFEDAEAWDGRVNGRLVPTGLYAYKVWVEPPIGIEVKEVGVVRVLSGE